MNVFECSILPECSKKLVCWESKQRTLPPYLPLDAGSLGTSLGFQLALSFICAFPVTTGGVVFIGVGVSFLMLIIKKWR